MKSSISTSRAIAWTIWFTVSIFYAYQYILRVMPSVMLDDIMQQFDMSAAVFGQFSGIYYIGYSLAHLPIGIALDRYGPRKTLTVCIFLTVLGLLPIAFTDHWIYPITGRVLVGIGSSGAILGLFKMIRMAFSEKHFTRMVSLAVTIGLIGAIYGGRPMSHLCDVFGYQMVTKWLALLGVVLATISYWIIPNVKSPSQNSVISNIKEVLSNSRVMWACIFAGLMVGPLEGFADVWCRAFLSQVYGFNDSLATSLPSMIFIGLCFGPLLSIIAEKTGNYLATIIGAGMVMAVIFFSFLVWRVTPEIFGFGFVVVGICCSYQILAIYKASTYVREELVGLTTAVANMIIMIFGYAFHTIIGAMINAMGGPNTSSALISGVVVVPVALCLGSLGFILLFVKERKKVTLF